MKLRNKIRGTVLFIASLLALGCLQDQTTTGPAVEKEAAPAAALQAIEQLQAMGFPASAISMEVSETKDTSFIIAQKIDKLSSAKGFETARLAFKKTTLDAARLRSEKVQAELNAEKVKTGEATVSADQPAVSRSLAKSSQTRWDTPYNDLDVKALTEVHQIKVYIQTTGSTKVGPKWIAAARTAMTMWNDIPGTEVSFVETSSATDNDVRLRAALSSSGGVTTWMTPDPWVEKDSVEIYFNLGYEDVFPSNQKIAFAMVALGNILNITHTGTEGGSWNGGDFANIAGTPYSDAASIFQPMIGPGVVAAFSENDIRAIQQLYPVWSVLAKNWNNDLVAAGWESPVTIANNVNTFQQEGDTVVFLKNDGSLWRRIGINGSNTQLWPTGSFTGALQSFILSEGYIAVQKTAAGGGTIYTRRPTTSWALQTAPPGAGVASQYRLGGERLVVYYPSTANLYSRWLATSPTYWSLDWHAVNLQDFRANSLQRLVIADNGEVFGMDGYNGWVYLWVAAGGGPARKVLLSKTHIAIFVENGSGYYYETLVKEGLGGTWESYGVPAGLEDADLCGDKFAVVNTGASLYIKDFGRGTSNAHWTLPGHYYTTMVRLSGPMCDHVTRVDYNADLFAKYSTTLETNYQYYHSGIVALQQRP